MASRFPTTRVAKLFHIHADARNRLKDCCSFFVGLHTHNSEGGYAHDAVALAKAPPAKNNKDVRTCFDSPWLEEKQTTLVAALNSGLLQDRDVKQR
jgi:hypothetical protein